MIDITNQRTIPFQFANRTTSKSDKVKTIQLLEKVRKYLNETLNLGALPNSVSFLNQNNKNSRIIIYNPQQLLSANDIFVVVFYANTRHNLSKKFNKEYIATDWKIAMSLCGSDNILCYASQELDDGDWFNLVLFTQESAKHTVMSTDTHHYAATTFASQRFNWIRLHNGYLPKGITQSREIALTKTKYYDFDENWFAYRLYKTGE